jgi:hypothetical protein
MAKKIVRHFSLVCQVEEFLPELSEGDIFPIRILRLPCHISHLRDIMQKVNPTDFIG